MTGIRSSATSSYEGGFADPVFNAQLVFRQIMDALARPGCIAVFDGLATPPPPVSNTVSSIAATLFDHDTKVWLDPALARNEQVTGWLTFNTSAPLTTEPHDAGFAIVSGCRSMPSLECFNQGTQEYPDRSTTLILQIGSLTGGRKLVLSGPGIENTSTIEPTDLPEPFLDQWTSNGARFPRGIDMLVAAPEGVIGLPRTVKISAGEN